MQTIKKRANKKQTVFQFQFALHSQHDGSILLRLLTDFKQKLECFQYQNLAYRFCLHMQISVNRDVSNLYSCASVFRIGRNFSGSVSFAVFIGCS